MRIFGAWVGKGLLTIAEQIAGKLVLCEGIEKQFRIEKASTEFTDDSICVVTHI